MPPRPEVVRALVGSVLREEGRGPHAHLLDPTADALVGRIAGMAPHLRAGITGLTAVFDWSAVVTGRHRFRHLSDDQRLRHIERWQQVAVGPLKDVVEFYEMMGTFLFYSEIERLGLHPGEGG